MAKGIIPYGQSNFANLLLQMRAMYEPRYEVASMSEKIAKIVNAGYEEDYIGDWEKSWTLDHALDARGYFTISATSVYFVKESKEVLFTQLFADIIEVSPDT